MNAEDPRWTAYVLGEAEPCEARELESAVSGDPGLAECIRCTGEMVERLRLDLAVPGPGLDPERRAELYARWGTRGVRGAEVRWWRRAAVLSAMAACLCVGVSIGLLLPSLGDLSGIPLGRGRGVSAKKPDADLLAFGFHLEPRQEEGGDGDVQVRTDSGELQWKGPDLFPGGGLAGVWSGGRGVPLALPPYPRADRRLDVVLDGRTGVRPSGGDAEGKVGNPLKERAPRVAGGGGSAVRPGAEGRQGVVSVAGTGRRVVAPVWGGDDSAGRERARRSLEAVCGALGDGRWPEPGSFSVAELVRAYADVVDAAGGRMDFRFSAAVAAFGGLLEKPEGADSARWDEVVAMAGDSGAGEELRQSLLVLIGKARRLAR